MRILVKKRFTHKIILQKSLFHLGSNIGSKEECQDVASDFGYNFLSVSTITQGCCMLNTDARSIKIEENSSTCDSMVSSETFQSVCFLSNSLLIESISNHFDEGFVMWKIYGHLRGERFRVRIVQRGSSIPIGALLGIVQFVTIYGVRSNAVALVANNAAFAVCQNT